MITEDYVSLEVAKLLNIKGFKGEFHKHYWGYEAGKEFLTESSFNSEYDYPAPTLQITMKWLLQEYRLYVNVAPSVEGYYWTGKWHSYVEDLNNKRYPFGKFIGTFNSPEEAVEAAIKYCLEHLI